MHIYIDMHYVSKPSVLPRYASLVPSREKAGDRASRSVGVRHCGAGRGLGGAEGASALMIGSGWGGW